MESLVNYESDEDTDNPSTSAEYMSAGNKIGDLDQNPRRDRRYGESYEDVKMELSEESDRSSPASDSVRQANRSRTNADSSNSSSHHRSNDLHRSSYSRDRRRSDRRSTSPRDRNGKDDRLSRSDDVKYRRVYTSSKDRNYRDKDYNRSRYEDRDRYRDSKYDRDHRDHDTNRRDDRDGRRHRDDRNRSHRERNYYHQDRSSRRRSRSRSRSRSGSRMRERNYRSDKAAQKRQLLEKLGIELQPIDPSSGSSASGDTITGTAIHNSFELPKYYNPGVMNPAKYAQQMQKRKLLWGNKRNDDAKSDKESGESSRLKGTNQNSTDNSASTSSGTLGKWTNTRFAQDTDGKVASKFMRLMGIKDAATPPPHVTPTEDVIKKQEEMFSSMEQQYEVARTVTHTMRGMGLGFGRQF